jgi:hypothetical protein
MYSGILIPEAFFLVVVHCVPVIGSSALSNRYCPCKYAVYLNRSVLHVLQAQGKGQLL